MWEIYDELIDMVPSCHSISRMIRLERYSKPNAR